MMNDGHNETGTGERKLIWEEENRLLAVNDNGFRKDKSGEKLAESEVIGLPLS